MVPLTYQIQKKMASVKLNILLLCSFVVATLRDDAGFTISHISKNYRKKLLEVQQPDYKNFQTQLCVFGFILRSTELTSEEISTKNIKIKFTFRHTNMVKDEEVYTLDLDENKRGITRVNFTRCPDLDNSPIMVTVELKGKTNNVYKVQIKAYNENHGVDDPSVPPPSLSPPKNQKITILFSILGPILFIVLVAIGILVCKRKKMVCFGGEIKENMNTEGGGEGNNSEDRMLDNDESQGTEDANLKRTGWRDGETSIRMESNPQKSNT